MFSIKDLDVALADIKNTNITYMAVKDLLFYPTGGPVSKQTRLPVAYQEVEYIQADGNQYIDTGYAPNNNTKIYAKFAHGAAQNQGPLFGARGRSGYTENNYQYILWSHCSEYNQGGTAMDNKPCPLFCHEYSTSSTSGGIKFLETRYPAGTVIEFEYDKYGGYYGPDNTWTWSPATNTANINMLIFGLRQGTEIDSRKFDGKLFAFKVWESGVAKRDFVPCFRKEDGEIGLYDLVNNEFYNNKGSGRFTRGANVRELVLPSRYQELTYIQSTATNPGTETSSGQYIDTGYTPNQYTKITIDMQFQSTATQSRLFGIHESSSSYMTMAAYINGSSKRARSMKNGEGDWLSTEVAVDTNRHTFTLKNGNYKIQTGNTVNYNSSNSGTSSTSARHTLPLLAAWNVIDNKIVDHSSARLYGCTIFENDVMVRNFVPCVNEYGDIGLYDLVEEKFYENAGTGSFTSGGKVDYLSTEKTLMYLNFEGNGNDISGNGNSVVSTSNMNYATGKLWQALQTNGGTSTSACNIARSGVGTAIGSGDFTISFWLYPLALDSNSYYPLVFGMFKTSNPYEGPNIFYNIDGTGKIRWRMRGTPDGGGGSWIGIDTNTPTNGERHHFVMTRRDGTVYCYIDKELMGSFDSLIQWPSSSFDGYFLSRADATTQSWHKNGVKGDNLIIESRGWSEKDIADYYNKNHIVYKRDITKNDIVFCEYVQGTGTQYIKTNIIPSNTKGVYMRLSSQDTATDLLFIGSRKSSDTRFWIGNSNGDNAKRVYLGWNTNDRGVISQDTIFEVKLNYLNDRKKQVDSSVILSNIGTLSSSNDVPIYIFAGNDNYSTDPSLYAPSKIKLYSCKISDGDTVIHDFVPCFLKFTGEAGLWDKIEEKFYPNAGTGDFLKGRPLYTKNDITECEWIGTNGSSSFIDTGVHATSDLQIETKVENAGTDATNVIFGSYLQNSSLNDSLGSYNHLTGFSSKFYYGLNGSEGNSGTFSHTAGAKYEIVFNNESNRLIVNGTDIGSVSGTTGYAGSTISISRRGTTYSGASRRGHYKYSYFKIYDKSQGKYIRDFVPCYITITGEVGMWDKVEGKFYPNAGTGVFTRSPDVVKKKDIAFCDYIQSTGTQYINTEEKGTQNTKIETTFTVTGVVGEYDFYYGAYGDTSNNGQYCMFLQSNYPADNKIRVVNYANGGSGKKYVDSLNNLELNRKYNITHTNTSFIIDGVSQGTMGASTFTTNYNMTIFGVVGGSVNKKALMKLYSFKMYSGNTLIKDFKPCYIKKTGEAGLWDEVEQKFYRNAGTGSFYRGKEGGLSTMYQKVEFLFANGSDATGQYIRTGFAANQDTSVEMKVKLATTTGNAAFFCSRDQATGTKLFASFRIGAVIRQDYYTTQKENIYTMNTTNQYVIKADKNKYYVDGVLLSTITSGTFTSPNAMLLLASHTGSGDTAGLGNCFAGKIYYAKIWDNGTLVRDFVPCYRKSDNTPGLYDLVNGIFYTNAGSGMFIKGRDV